MRLLTIFVITFSSAFFSPITVYAADQSRVCLDGFCIGQSIKDVRFDNVEWIVPRSDFRKARCDGIGCKPEIAFHGYPEEQQKQLAEAVSWVDGIKNYTVIKKDTLNALRHYQYECNLSQGSLFGERRFLAVYRSIPSHYLTVVGLRLIDGDLKIYRVARRYPYQNQNELVSLAKKLRGEYGDAILFYDYLSSNAYSDVIKEHKNGWFGRSTMFNSTDLSDNAAELVLVDPRTRSLLVPSSMPDSGEIEPLPVNIPGQCDKSLPIQ